ncbi:MAG: DUF748 domain-containing protein [Flavobacterium sp.]
MKIRNKIIITLASLLIFIALAIVVLQSYAKSYVEKLISEKIPSNYSLHYSDVDVSLLFGNIALHNTTLKIKDKDKKDRDTLEYHTYLKTENLEINGVGYYNLLFNKTISIHDILLKKPKIKYYPYKHIASKDTTNHTNDKKLEFLNIKKLVIEKGNISIMKNAKDSIKMAISSYDLTLEGSKINLQSEQKMPLIYDNYTFEGQKIILDNGNFDSVRMDSISATNESVKMANFQIVPKYSKKELSTHLKKERDYIDLKVAHIILEKIKLNFDNPRLGIAAKSVTIEQPNAEIYRDKLIADDLVVKPLYSKSLRNLSFDLDVNEIKIKKGYISYAELVDPDKKAGKLFFDEVNATLYNVSNLKKGKNTEIKVNSKLMGNAPLTLDWKFDVHNKSDAFTVNGSVKNLEASLLNPFFTPNLNAIAEGTLEQLYFNFQGNVTASKGEMKMKYQEFNFKILRKDSNKVNKLFTAIGKIFVRKDSKADPKDFRLGQIEAERDNTKSFFNYLWINVKSGLISTLIGNGKK